MPTRYVTKLIIILLLIFCNTNNNSSYITYPDQSKTLLNFSNYKTDTITPHPLPPLPPTPPTPSSSFQEHDLSTILLYLILGYLPLSNTVITEHSF